MGRGGCGNQNPIPTEEVQGARSLSLSFILSLRSHSHSSLSFPLSLLPIVLPSDEKCLFTKEVEILRKLRHPNIIQFYGYTIFQESQFAIVTEFMSRGDLQSHIKENWPISEERRHQFALDIARGMGYLHHKNIIHRDLTSSNVLLADDFTV